MQRHPSFNPEVERRRQAEFDAATSRYQVDALLTKWQQEDAALEAAGSVQAREIRALHERLGAIERVLGPGGKSLSDLLIGAIGQAVGAAIAKSQDRTLAKAEERSYLSYAGTWDPEDTYRQGTMVTHAGATWVAMTAAEKGSKPGKAAVWRLCAKSEPPRGPAVA